MNTSLMITSLYDVLKDEINNNTKLYLIGDFDKVLSLDLLKDEEIDEDYENYSKKKIQERTLAKQNQDYERADQIRDELLAKNVIIKDTREGTTFEITK